MTDEIDLLETSIREFKRSAEITRDVRFQAALRLSGRQRGSSYIVSLLSLFVIALSLLPNILELQPAQSQILLACSVVLSVFVIFTSLIDGSQNFYHQGELLHRCARRVATVYLSVKNLDPTADPGTVRAELEKLQEQYRQALDECPVNHENVDYAMEQGRKPHLFPQNFDKGALPGQAKRRLVQAHLWVHAWMIPHIVALLAVCGIVYWFVLARASMAAPTLAYGPMANTISTR